MRRRSGKFTTVSRPLPGTMRGMELMMSPGFGALGLTDATSNDFGACAVTPATVRANAAAAAAARTAGSFMRGYAPRRSVSLAGVLEDDALHRALPHRLPAPLHPPAHLAAGWHAHAIGRDVAC